MSLIICQHITSFYVSEETMGFIAKWSYTVGLWVVMDWSLKISKAGMMQMAYFCENSLYLNFGCSLSLTVKYVLTVQSYWWTTLIANLLLIDFTLRTFSVFLASVLTCFAELVCHTLRYNWDTRQWNWGVAEWKTGSDYRQWNPEYDIIDIVWCNVIYQYLTQTSAVYSEPHNVSD